MATDTNPDTNPPPPARLVGGLLLWFAALGGAVAWAVHLIVAWGVVELACLSGHDHVAGMPLELVTAIAVIVPGLVTVAALIVSTVAWRRIRHPDDSTGGGGGSGAVEPARLSRGKLLAVVGLWSNLLFTAIIAFDGVALVVIPPCQM